MCENSGATDAASLRREIRRKKILEFSSNRLKLIEGLNSHNSNTPSLYSRYNIENPYSEFNCKVDDDSTRFENFSRNNINDDDYDVSKLKSALNENKDLKEISDLLFESKEKDSKDYDEDSIQLNVSGQNEKISIINEMCKRKLHYILLAVTILCYIYLHL
ncbi:hypothetical protein Phum_PHUM128060 [Pediculus humanus corporis]|uniref:Uncharacterized protein n=1 Tax=Pediculus humanus subsp. corporis TaxID=121224 RepID=E0VE37_PEDHC|nr:uncharacterized protein Phum_PHUM128060 [Pediculus humanus corporis]EEB11643.1 hypothetical protein Phum_PHUM128060 [Pediculus humanus corporis]